MYLNWRTHFSLFVYGTNLSIRYTIIWQFIALSDTAAILVGKNVLRHAEAQEVTNVSQTVHFRCIRTLSQFPLPVFYQFLLVFPHLYFQEFHCPNLQILKLLVVRVLVNAVTECGPSKPIRCFCFRCSVIWREKNYYILMPKGWENCSETNWLPLNPWFMSKRAWKQPQI